MSAGDVAIAYALSQVGKPYRWGATGPDSFDCSGLCYAAYRHAGVNIPRTTSTQINSGRAVARNALAPGDLVFPHAGHVWMYLGNGRCVEAPHTGDVVKVITLGTFIAARRFAVPGQPITWSGKVHGPSYAITPTLSIPIPGPIPGGPNINVPIPGTPDVPGQNLIPNPLNKVGGAVVNALVGPLVDLVTGYAIRYGEIVGGVILMLVALFMFDKTRNAAKTVAGHVQTGVDVASP